MLVTKEKAAIIAGISRRTLYNHIPKKEISISVDEDGNEKIDVSELKRVYGAEKVMRNLKTLMDAEEGGVQDSAIAQSNSQESLGETFLKELLAKEKEERAKDREIFAEQMTMLQERIKDAQKETTRLLEDKRNEKEKPEWEQSFKALESRLANQEQERKDEKELRRKILSQNKSLKNALTTEKNKPFWKKLLNK